MMQIRPDSLFAKYERQQANQHASGRNIANSELASASGTNSFAASFTTPNSLENAQASKGSFLDLVTKGVGKVNEMQQTSTLEVEKMLSGEDVESAEVFSGLQKADMAFRLLVQVRNKLMQAYEEINSIRI